MSRKKSQAEIKAEVEQRMAANADKIREICDIMREDGGTGMVAYMDDIGLPISGATGMTGEEAYRLLTMLICDISSRLGVTPQVSLKRLEKFIPAYQRVMYMK